MAKNFTAEERLSADLQQASEAIEHGDTQNAINIIRSIPNLANLCNTNTDAFASNLIKQAILNNNVEVIKALRAIGVDFNVSTYDETNWISWALNNTSVQSNIIETLLEHGTSVDSGDFAIALTMQNKNPIKIEAALQGTLRNPENLLLYLVSALAGNTPTLFDQIINQTLENCKDLASKANFLFHALIILGTSNPFTENLKRAILQLLQDPEAKDFVNIENTLTGNGVTCKITPAMIAFDLDILKSLHAKGANLNAVMVELNRSVINIFSGNNCDSNLVEYLIDNVSIDSISKVDMNGNSAVYYIARNYPNKLPKLLTRGVDINPVNKDGLTPLVKLIIDSGEVEGVKMLITLGAKINTTNFSYDAILKLATENQWTQLETWLKVAKDVDGAMEVSGIKMPEYSDLANSELYAMRVQSLEKITKWSQDIAAKEDGKQEVEYVPETQDELSGLDFLYDE